MAKDFNKALNALGSKLSLKSALKGDKVIESKTIMLDSIESSRGNNLNLSRNINFIEIKAKQEPSKPQVVTQLKAKDQ